MAIVRQLEGEWISHEDRRWTPDTKSRMINFSCNTDTVNILFGGCIISIRTCPILSLLRRLALGWLALAASASAEEFRRFHRRCLFQNRRPLVAVRLYSSDADVNVVETVSLRQSDLYLPSMMMTTLSGCCTNRTNPVF